MANERLVDFPAKASPVPADIIYVGDSADSYNEVQSTIAQIIAAYPNLSSVALLTSAANKLAYYTGAGTAALTDLTAYARTLLDDANASAAQTTLGLVIGVNVQAYNATLNSISALGTAADKMIYTTGISAWAETDATAVGRAILNLAAGSAGQVLRSNGANWIASTSTFADTYAINTLLYAGAANTVSGLASVNSAPLVTSATGVPTWLGSMTNGQLVIGSTGAIPVLATLTAGAGISIVNTAGGIQISAGGGGFSWTEVTGVSQAMAVNNGYIANNAALVTLTLPAAAVIGDSVTVVGKGAGLWKIAQNAGQTIYNNSTASTTGAGGSVTATAQYNAIELVCVTANNDWVVTDHEGSLTFV